MLPSVIPQVQAIVAGFWTSTWSTPQFYIKENAN
jgi:hypothetical protein